MTGTAFGEVSANTALSAPAGYYLLKDKDAVTGDDAATLFIVQVNGPVTVNRKANKPTFEKKVKDVNDSTGDKSDWQDSADYDVNDEVPFQLTATLPTNEADFAAYKTYKLVFHDQQSAGLTFNKDSVVVKYGDQTLGTDSYTLETPATDNDTFDITITDAKTVKDADGSAITVATGGKFTVEYTSTLNENAVIGAAGNPNEASLEFSNNPNVGGEGNTGKTPTDKVIVFTYQLDINKTFNGGTPDDNDLPEFTLYKFDSATNDYTTNVARWASPRPRMASTPLPSSASMTASTSSWKLRLRQASTPPTPRSSTSPLNMTSSLTTRSLRCSKSTPLPATPLPVRSLQML